MTLIFGINLADRIYISSDTRLTSYSCDKEIFWVKDNILKTAVINNDIIVAVAGNLHLSKFLVNNLKKDSLTNVSINKLREQISPWMAHQVDIYLKTNNYAACTLLFGGIDRSKKKIISGKKFISLVKDFQTKFQTEMTIKTVLLEGLKSKGTSPNPFPELPIADSLLFGIHTDAKNNILDIEDASWGEYLAYGPKGFSVNDIPLTAFGRLEFEKGAGNPVRDSGLIATMITILEKEKKLLSVGGGVITFMTSAPDGVLLPSCKVYRSRKKTINSPFDLILEVEVVNSKICYRTSQKGKWINLITFTSYQTKKSLGENLI